METALAKLPELTGIELAIAQPIIDAYLPHYNAAMERAEKAKGINVTDPTDLDGIEAADTLRKAFKSTRGAAEHIKDEKKDPYLRMANAVQKIRNRIWEICEPNEKRLMDMVKIAERIQAERKEKVAQDRANALSPYMQPGEAMFSGLGELTPQNFEALLAGRKAAHEKRLADAAKAEEERLAAEFDRREREEAMAAENARREEEDRKQREVEDIQREEQRRQLAALEEKARQERAAAEAIARKEREARAKAEAELAAQKKAQTDEVKRIAAAKAKAEAAPDKAKLIAFADTLTGMSTPGVKSDAANILRDRIECAMTDLIGWIRKEADKL